MKPDEFSQYSSLVRVYPGLEMRLLTQMFDSWFLAGENPNEILISHD